MITPKHSLCEHYAAGYGRIPYRICRKSAKLINKTGGYKTSPMWCPLRVVAKSAIAEPEANHD